MKLPNDNTMGHCLFTFPTHSQLNVDPIRIVSLCLPETLTSAFAGLRWTAFHSCCRWPLGSEAVAVHCRGQRPLVVAAFCTSGVNSEALVGARVCKLHYWLWLRLRKRHSMRMTIPVDEYDVGIDCC